MIFSTDLLRCRLAVPTPESSRVPVLRIVNPSQLGLRPAKLEGKLSPSVWVEQLVPRLSPRTPRRRRSPTLFGTYSLVVPARLDLLVTLFSMGASTILKRHVNALILFIGSVDLDIEGGSSTGFAAFVTRIRSHATGASKKSVFVFFPVLFKSES
jgi:hypothetical protein